MSFSAQKSSFSAINSELTPDNVCSNVEWIRFGLSGGHVACNIHNIIIIPIVDATITVNNKIIVM